MQLQILEALRSASRTSPRCSAISARLKWASLTSALVAIALDETFGAGEITFLERDDAEGVLRRGDVRIQLQRPTKELLGARQISRSIQISPIW